MKFWMHGLFAGSLAGALWAGMWQLVLTMVLIVSTGAPLSLQLGPAVLTGISVGVIAMTMRRDGPLRRHLIGAVLTGLLLFGFSLGSPFDPQGLVTVWQSGLFLLMNAIVIWLSISATVGNTPATRLTRYLAEIFYLRLLWGQGLMLFVLIVAIPFYVMVMTSLKNQQSLLLNPLDFSTDPTVGADVLFRSYIELFTKYDFLTLLVNSAVVSVVTVLITLLFSIPGAYAVAKLRFPGRQWLSGSVLLIYLIPAIILVIPLYAVFSQLGLRNSLLGLCIVYPATTIPVALYMLRGYFAGLPSELDDAGLMDGLTRLQIITRIAMPLSTPAIATVALYVFMIAWNEFLFAFMFLDDVKLFTLSRGIVSLDSSEVPRQHLMAGSVIATLPVLMLFLWFERFLVSGLTAGSVKG
ncbi:MAG: carbohydrate ABC transporter permease [Pseudomonadota bacterium]|nr:carbohydrate ABC transporter permease [Pseudomonadota bacterium]